jgi:ABC-type multidrug transport system permease subunit
MCLIIILTYLTGASYGIIMSVYLSKIEIIMATIPVVCAPLYLYSGVFLNNNDMFVWLRWFEYLSMYKWGYQAAAIVF